MDNDDDDIGYRKPPRATQYKKGQSGNPNGRQKGSKNKRPSLNGDRLGAIVLEEAYRNVKVTDSNRQIDLPMASAIIRSIAVSAAKGKLGAQQMFIEILREAERREKRIKDELLLVAFDYKESWREELEHCAEAGVEPPELYPHPDDIHILATGEVIVTGPLTKKQKVEDDKIRKRKKEFQQSITELEQFMLDHPEYKEDVLKDIKWERKILKILESMVPD